MTSEQNGSLVYTLVLLVLVASSLFARRLPISQKLRMLLIWIGIFAAIFLVFSYRHDLRQVWARVSGELAGGGMTAADGTLRVPVGEDGHYHVNAQVNGHAVRFMVDSGATTTSLSSDAARAAEIDVDMSGFPVVLETANGMSEARRARIARLVVGPIARSDFPVLVSDNLGETSLIGMNWLSSLKSWRVEGSVLVLNP